MRVLFVSTQGAGHYSPLVPFIAAARRGGHDVLVVVPPALAATVEEAGFPLRVGADPPEEELSALWSGVPHASPDEANEIVIGEIFARLDTEAMLPTLREACREWRPDLVLRDPSEFASAVAAEEAGVAHARAACGLADIEVLSLGIAEPVLERLRAGVVSRIRESSFLTFLPETIDESPFGRTLRFSDPSTSSSPRPLPDWWSGDERPLVYVTFGSVTGALPLAPVAYSAALEAVAELPVRVLLTIGRRTDPELVSRRPANVHVEAWVPQADVLGHARVVVGHGGYGTMTGTLAAGVPSVVVPLFADQPYNARRVEEVGAGVVAAAEPTAIRDALETVLGDPSYGQAAEAIAAAMRSLPPVDAAFDALAR